MFTKIINFPKEQKLIIYIYFLTLDDLLPYFGERHNFPFVEGSVFTGEKLKKGAASSFTTFKDS